MILRNLRVDIPRSIEHTFYDGHVHVWLKQSAFEASSPYRYVAEMEHILDIEKPIVGIYSDGGLDYRITYRSVQVSLINIFPAGDYDMLIACLLHHAIAGKIQLKGLCQYLILGFSRLMRTKSDDEMEKILSSASSLGYVCVIAEKRFQDRR